jgi:hypothetical protein
MTTNMATIRAEFDGTEFLITDRISDLQDHYAGRKFLPYLSFLSATGWQVMRGRFDGWVVVIDLEKQMETPYQISAFMLLMFNHFPAPDGLSATVDLQSRLLNELQAIRVKEGWEILAGPKHLVKDGIWTISLWVKHYPET